MPWTKAHDVTAQDVEAFEMLLDDIAQQDRDARLRAAHHFEASNHDRLMLDGWQHADAQPCNVEPCHD